MKLLSCVLALVIFYPCVDTANSQVPKDIIDYEKDEQEVTLGPQDFAEAHEKPDPDVSAFVEGDPTLTANKFEGDIAGHKEDEIKNYIKASNTKELGRNAIRNRYQRWPDGRIPYTLSSRYGSSSRRVIARAMEEYHTRTCIRFVPRSTERNYVYIHPDDGCYSLVGRVGGRQPLSLDAGCMMKGTIMHELMHATGFFHEQSRADRDEHITLIKDNLLPSTEDQFQKYSLRQITHLGSEYDYGSIMHYSQYAFSRRPGRRGGETIIAKDASKQHLMGNRRDFSKNDLYKLNKLYECETKIDETDIDDGGDGETSGTGNCDDDRWDCKIRKFLGYCDYDRETRDHCQRTCGTCETSGGSGGGRPAPSTTTRRPDSRVGGSGGSECENQKDKCEDWKARGYCDKFQKYMGATCKRSCGLCSDSDSELPRSNNRRTTTTRRPPVPETQNSQCRDKNFHCTDWLETKPSFCTDYPNYMKSACAKSCKYCSTTRDEARPQERSATTGECKDLHRRCSEYAEDGYCDTAEGSERRKMMNTYCKSSCGLCR